MGVFQADKGRESILEFLAFQSEQLKQRHHEYKRL